MKKYSGSEWVLMVMGVLSPLLWLIPHSHDHGLLCSKAAVAVAFANAGGLLAAYGIFKKMDGLFGLGMNIFSLGCVIGAIAMDGLGYATAPIVFVIGLGVYWRSQRHVRDLQKQGVYPQDGQGTDADVARLESSGEHLLALKLYREIHTVTLEHAKQGVAALMHKNQGA